MTLPEFFLDRKLAKRQAALDRGLDPYPYRFELSHTPAEILARFDELATVGDELASAGRVLAVREMGRSSFVDLTAGGTILQVYVPRSEGSAVVGLLDLGDWIGVTGQPFRTRTGHPTIRAKSLTLLSKSVADVPFGKVYGDKSSYALTDIEARREMRYLDWITNPESLVRSETACRVVSSIRRFMESEGFLEVTTPTLEPVYGGAEARPFTTGVWALGGQRMYLRISPELYLKRYIIGGFPKVFTICQNFRNEGIDSTHNPEFTMMEWYEAFSDYEDQMARFERLTCHLVESVHRSLVVSYRGRMLDFRPPWPRLRVPDLIQEVFGKPAQELEREDVAARVAERVLAGAAGAKQSREGVEAEIRGASVGELLMLEVEYRLQQRDGLWSPCFLCDHPRDISPLTKAKRGNPFFVERFEPYVGAMEIGNAYSELTDPVEQYERFTEQRQQQSGNNRGYENHPIDLDFLHALGCGMPPTGGVGYGVDRILMILLDQESIRDVIPFPMRRAPHLRNSEA